MKYLSIFIFLILNPALIGQSSKNNLPFGKQTPFIIQKLTDPILLDGRLNEACWQVAEELKEFTQYFPSDSLKALGSTKMYMCYDDEALYVAA
ncbi:MAG: hypothetical protein HKN67_04780, partial [Saprospiraceae bacterium]|nr:hypothetical protein [Bacteroidia bacterium]NNF21233.1 hypothetical protein [Saprospiraceae bacterium]